MESYLPAVPIIDSVGKLLEASLSELSDFDWLCQHIAEAGLQPGPDAGYGDRWMPFVREYGAWQQPEQLAKLLLLARELNAKSYCEIGIWRGYCLATVATYLYRFNTDFRAVGVDVLSSLRHEDGWHELLQRVPISLRTCDSSAMQGEVFDLVFIDGDHRYEAVRSDWENVGKYAKVCAFHDCSCDHVRSGNPCGGVPRFWQELRTTLDRPVVEIFDSPKGTNWMGIGVVLN